MAKRAKEFVPASRSKVPLTDAQKRFLAESKARDRMFSETRKAVIAVLPAPLTNVQRAALDELVLMNLANVGT